METGDITNGAEILEMNKLLMRSNLHRTTCFLLLVDLVSCNGVTELHYRNGSRQRS